MLLWSISFVFMAIGLLGPQAVHADCLASAISTCFPSLTTAANMATYTDAQLTGVCSTVTAGVTCIQKATCSPTDTTQNLWVGVRDVFAYLCGDGRAAYLRNAACFTSGGFNATSAICALNISSIQSIDPCTIQKAMVACMTDGTKKACNSDEAGRVLGVLMSKMMQPQVPSNCTLYVGPMPVSPITPSGGVVITASVLTAVAAYLSSAAFI